MTKPEKPSVFEALGYGKYDPKPEYKSHALLKTKEGWVVFEIVMRGLQVSSVEMVCQPTVKAFAAERFRILSAHSIRSNDG